MAEQAPTNPDDQLTDWIDQADEFSNKLDELLETAPASFDTSVLSLVFAVKANLGFHQLRLLRVDSRELRQTVLKLGDLTDG